MPSAPTLEQLAAKKHPEGSIFNAFPAIGTAVVDGTTTAIPYHNYDCAARSICAARPEWVQERLVGPWKPLLGKDGRAQVALSLFDYKDTVVNPYKELILVFSTVHASKSVAPISFAHQQLQLFDDKVVPARARGGEPTAVRLLRSRAPRLRQVPRSRDEGRVRERRRQLRVPSRRQGGQCSSRGPALVGQAQAPSRRLNMHLMSLVGAYGLCRTSRMCARGVTTCWPAAPPTVACVAWRDEVAANSKDYNRCGTVRDSRTTRARPNLVYGGY